MTKCIPMRTYILLVLSFLSISTMNAKDNLLRIHVGTYTDTQSEGIYTYTFNQNTGDSKFVTTTDAVNPSFIVLSPDKSTIYAVSESAKPTDYLCAFSYDNGLPEQQVGAMQTDGIAPCNIACYKGFVITSNYTSGSISIFSTNHNGSLAERRQVINFPFIGKAVNSIRQQSAHLHCVKPSPDGNFLFACDLGNDCIYTLQMDESDSVKVVNTKLLPTETGPRHLIFSKNGEYGYMISELSGEVFVFSRHNGRLETLQIIECDQVGAHGSADIHLSPDERFLYASNRLKNDGIAIYRVQKDGTLKSIGYQATADHPRNFAITPNGKYLLCACRDGNRIEIYEINHKTGLLNNIGKDIKLPHPVCVLIAE